jgi:hypothetical protein
LASRCKGQQKLQTVVSGAHLLTSKDAWLDTFQAIIALNATRQCIGKQTNDEPTLTFGRFKFVYWFLVHIVGVVGNIMFVYNKLAVCLCRVSKDAKV